MSFKSQKLSVYYIGIECNYTWNIWGLKLILNKTQLYFTSIFCCCCCFIYILMDFKSGFYEVRKFERVLEQFVGYLKTCT